MFETRALHEQVWPTRVEIAIFSITTETSEPHLVLFDSLQSQRLTAFGSYLNVERHDLFPLGINVNQVEVLGTTTIAVKTYRQSVNRMMPTQACVMPGSTSSAVLSFLLDKVQNATIHVQTSGGALVIAPLMLSKTGLCYENYARIWQPQ